MAYFIVDKIAFFLKHYLGLSVFERDAVFRKVWYREGRRRNGLEPVVEGARSWLLRGLFWLSKDLHEEDPVFREALELQETAYRFGHPTSRGQGWRPETPSAALRWRGAEDTFQDLAHGLRRMHLPRHIAE